MKSKVTYPNDVTVDYAYEQQRDLLTGVRNSRGETVYSEYLYANDALVRRTAKDGERYSYNARSELTNATDSVHAPHCYAYNYDDIGNRTASSDGVMHKGKHWDEWRAQGNSVRSSEENW